MCHSFDLCNVHVMMMMMISLSDVQNQIWRGVLESVDLRHRHGHHIIFMKMVDEVLIKTVDNVHAMMMMMRFWCHHFKYHNHLWSSLQGLQ